MSPIWLVALRVSSARFLTLAGDHREAAPGVAPRPSPPQMVGIEGQKVGLLGNSLDGAGDAGDLLQNGLERFEAALHALDRRGELGDMSGGAGDGGGSGFRHLAAGAGGGGLGRAGGAVDVAVSRHHGLGGLLQLPELFRLARDPVGHVLEVAGNIGGLHPQRSDPVGEIADQADGIACGLADRGGRGVAVLLRCWRP